MEVHVSNRVLNQHVESLRNLVTLFINNRAVITLRIILIDIELFYKPKNHLIFFALNCYRLDLSQLVNLLHLSFI